MTGGVVTEVPAAVASLRAAVDALLAADPSMFDGTELAQVFAAVEVERRRLEAVDHALLAQLEQSRLAGEYGRSSTVELLRELARVAPNEATARIRAAHDLGPRRELSGAALPPLFTRVAQAQAAGQIGAAQARVITGCIDALPQHLAAEAAGPAEEFLVDQARHLDARLLATVARRLLATIDPDGAEPREQDRQRRRSFDLTRHADGSWVIKGRVSDEFAAVYTAMLDPLAAPHPGMEADDRSATQRRHDAMLEIGTRLLRSGTLPDCGGTPVTVLATITLPDLVNGTGTADLGTQAQIATAALRRLADESELITTVFSATGAILCAGRTRRLASATQRRLLAARDRGCCFPGCTRPPAWCQAHHVLPYADGGATDIDNLCLLCDFHHREFEHRGWTVRMVDGTPQWTPPTWLDPLQQPIRNTAHHLPEFQFHPPDPTSDHGPP